MEIKLLTPGHPTPIQIGTSVQLLILPIRQNGTRIDLATLTNIAIKVGGARTTYAHTIQGEYIAITLPSTETEGVYDVVMEATQGTTPLVCGWNDLYSRVKYSNCINYEQYETRMIFFQTPDADLNQATAACETARLAYLASKSQYDSAKAALIEQALALQDIAKDATVAKEAAATANKQAILQAISEIEIDIPEGIAMEAQATLNKEAILAAIDNIDLSSIIGTDTTATLTALKGLIQALPDDADLTALKNALQGADTTATLSAIKTLIQAIPTTPISDYATETNATANKNTILAAIPTVPTDYAKQGNISTVTLTGVDTKVGDLDDIVDAINGDDISGILGYYTDEYADELESIIGTSNNE